MAGELLHLLTLAVALNLGIGALIWFGEPARVRLENSLSHATKQFERVVAEQDTQDEQEIRYIFQFGLKLLHLQSEFSAIEREFRVVDDAWFKLCALVFAGIAFVSSLLCTIYYTTHIAPAWAVAAAFLSIIPMAFGIYYFMVYNRFNRLVYPQISTLSLLQKKAIKGLK